MPHRYTAKIYFDQDEIARESGDEIEQLYNWMLIKTHEMFGNFHGEIIDNKTAQVVKRFRKSPPD